MKQDDNKQSKAMNSLALGEISSAELTGQTKELVLYTYEAADDEPGLE